MEFKSWEYKSIISFVEEFSKRKSSLFPRHTVITMELAGGVVEKTVIMVSLEHRVYKSERLGLEWAIIFHETDQLVEDFI